MRSNRIAITTVMLGALALPLATAASATAAPGALGSNAHAALPSIRDCDRPGPWVIGARAVTIRSKATTKSTAVGILYRGHSFTVHKSSGGWHYITDRTTGVKGWVSGTYVYREVYMCLD